MKYIKRLYLLANGVGALYIAWILFAANRQQTISSPSSTTNGHDSREPADNPAELSKTGWQRALLQTKAALRDKQLGTQAAGLAYYATLTFFPALLGAATLFASFTSPHQLLNDINGLKGIVPPTIYDLIHQQLSPLASAHRGSIGVAAVISIAALLWTTSGGLQNLIKATNVAYDAHESRGFIKLRLLSLALSGALLALIGIILTLLLLQRGALLQIGFSSGISTTFPYLRWPLLIVFMSIALSIIYRYAPNRDAPRWSWVSWGATAATIIWLIGTAAFFYYTQHFGNFSKSYGIFAGIIVLMTWFNLTSLIILIGAQVNKKLEDITTAETT